MDILISWLTTTPSAATIAVAVFVGTPFLFLAVHELKIATAYRKKGR